MKHWLVFSILVALATAVGCQKKKAPVEEPQEEVTLRPYATPLHDSILARRFDVEFKTPETLCEKMLEYLEKMDTVGLIRITVSQSEYLNWIWPEEPASQPKFNIPLSFAWDNLYLNSVKALYKILYKYGGRKWQFASLSFEESVPHQTYIYHRKPKLMAVDENGQEIQIKGLGTVVEMNRQFKFLYYHEKF